MKLLVQSIAQPLSSKDHPSEISLSPEVMVYVTAAISPSTRRAYQGNLRDFLLLGGSVPCSHSVLAEYIAHRAAIHSPFTVARLIVGISRAHSSLSLPDPSKSDLVRAVMRGLRRIEGKPQRKAAPVLREDLFPMLEQTRGLKGIRDRALLLVGFTAALRPSELVGLNVDELQFVKEGLLVHLLRSKTDQQGEGRKIAIPYGRTSACAVKSVQHWLEAAAITTGPVFRSGNKVGAVSASRLTDQSVSLIVKGYARTVGLPAKNLLGPQPEGRAGLVTSAAKAGISFLKIQQQTGHRSTAMLTRYIRDAQVFENNAAGLLL